MPESTVEKIMNNIKQVSAQYYRLIILVAPAGSGKTKTLSEVSISNGIPLLNLNLLLSEQLMDVTEKQRIISIGKIIEDILSKYAEETIILDNIEMLFNPQLKQDPLGLLKKASRNKTLIIAWNGTIDNKHLIYSEPGFPEYKKYDIQDITVISPDM